MQEIILSIIAGVVVIVIGILNVLGQIGMLHTYHRKRVPLLLMTLLPWQQNCRLSHGPHHTSHHSSPCMTVIQTPSNS